MQEVVLGKKILSNHFLLTELAIVGLMIMVFYQLINIIRNDAKKEKVPVFTWLICAAIIVFLSVEVHLFFNHIFYSPTNTVADIRRVYLKTGLAILWGLSSFVFMWLGMQHKYQPLRIISLTLFSITLVKLFAYDIQNIPPAGKIAAFFCLGVLLLVISFMYQRLKKIIIEDTKPAEVKD
jgi:uncharacterized membrane protein